MTIVTEPSVEPVSLEEAEDHLRLSDTSTGVEDTVILSYIKAARRVCERIQNRAYIEQTWNLVLNGFPASGGIKIPLPPLISVSHVKYYGTGGTATTMTAANYYVDTDSEPGGVYLAYGEVWPSATLRPNNGVEIQFVAGYGSAASSVPMEVRQAIKLLTGHLYENREATTPDKMQARDLPLGVQSLLWLDRVVPI